MFTLTLALRYLKGRKKLFFNFSNLLSLTGIVIGVFALLVVSSVMNGFDADMRERVVGSKADIMVYNSDYSPIDDYDDLSERIENIKGIVAAEGVCKNELMLQNRRNIISTLCYGVDFNRHSQVSSIFDKIRVGDPEATSLEDDGIIIGLDMSLTLNVTVGEEVKLTSPIGTEPSPFGLLPKNRKFKVVGLFISGLPEYDKLFSFISLKNSQYFSGIRDAVDHIEVKTEDADSAPRIAVQLRGELGPDYIVEDWSIFDANLFNAIRMEKIIMFLVLTLMIVISAFNMTGNYIKLVAEKRMEIGILKAIGTSGKMIENVFITAGLVIGVTGAVLGTLSALILLLVQQKWHLIKIPVPGFPLHWIPVEIRWLDFIIVPLIVVLISYLTTLYPSRKTVGIDAVKTIRNI